MTAPSGSFTVPVSVARSTWAWTGIGSSTRAASSNERFMGTSATFGTKPGSWRASPTSGGRSGDEAATGGFSGRPEGPGAWSAVAVVSRMRRPDEPSPAAPPVVVTVGAAARAGLSAGAPVRGRGRDPGVVRALRLGRARPRGGGPRALGRRSPAAARPPGSRKPGGVPRPARGARRRRAPARPGERRALVRARDGGRAGRERPGRGGDGGRSRPRGARARADRPRAEGRARAVLRRAARRLGRDPSGRGRRPRAALLDRVQPRGRRHAARPADGDLGSGGRHRARLRGGARRRGWTCGGRSTRARTT